MPRLTKIYTRTGDDGTTALGSRKRVPKFALRIEAYGTVDELNSALGVARAAKLNLTLQKMLNPIQNDLFHLGSDLCVSEADKKKFKLPQIEQRHVRQLEYNIDQLQLELQPLANFILPGGSPGAAHLHLARCICRRAERILCALKKKERIGKFALQYLNRLSDLLFVMSRYENLKKGVPEPLWDSRA